METETNYWLRCHPINGGNAQEMAISAIGREQLMAASTMQPSPNFVWVDSCITGHEFMLNLKVFSHIELSEFTGERIEFEVLGGTSTFATPAVK